jgi:hypothetical protein
MRKDCELVGTERRLKTSFYNLQRHAVAQLVEALRYNPEGSGFDTR